MWRVPVAVGRGPHQLVFIRREVPAWVESPENGLRPAGSEHRSWGLERKGLESTWAWSGLGEILLLKEKEILEQKRHAQGLSYGMEKTRGWGPGPLETGDYQRVRTRQTFLPGATDQRNRISSSSWTGCCTRKQVSYPDHPPTLQKTTWNCRPRINAPHFLTIRKRNPIPPQIFCQKKIGL